MPSPSPHHVPFTYALSITPPRPVHVHPISALIGSTEIDIEDRIFSKQWKAACRSKPPVERRALSRPDFGRQGTVDLFVEVLSEAEATGPPLDISPPPEQKWEMRLIIWSAREVGATEPYTLANGRWARAARRCCGAIGRLACGGGPRGVITGCCVGFFVQVPTDLDDSGLSDLYVRAQYDDPWAKNKVRGQVCHARPVPVPSFPRTPLKSASVRVPLSRSARRRTRTCVPSGGRRVGTGA
jgi:hypothetical protein